MTKVSKRKDSGVVAGLFLGGDEVWGVLNKAVGSALPGSLSSVLRVGAVAQPYEPTKEALPQLRPGLHTDDSREFFLPANLIPGHAGILRMKRSEDGSWSAKVDKQLLPRVLSKEAVDNGWLPSHGSGLPESLEWCVPNALRYWESADLDDALYKRAALVAKGIFQENLLKIVDGEIRLCAQKLYLYEPDQTDTSTPESLGLNKSFDSLIGDRSSCIRMPLTETRKSQSEARQALAKSFEAVSGLTLLSLTPDMDPEVVAKVVRDFAQPFSAWLVESPDTPAARSALSTLGPVYKAAIKGAADLIFVSNFEPHDLSIVSWLDADTLVKAEWSVAEINNLPDSAFLFIEEGGEIDEEDKTKPRALRHFPVRDASGQVDLPHLRNALARIPQSNLPADVKRSITLEARDLLDKATGLEKGCTPTSAKQRKEAGDEDEEGAETSSPFEVRDFQGIAVTIDRPKGFTQEGVGVDGKPWSRTYRNDYGFIAKTEGGDNEDLDVFLGDDLSQESAVWISQNKPDGTFDEYKVFLGFPSIEAAVETYKAHIPEQFMGEVTIVPVSHMKSLLGLPPTELTKTLANIAYLAKCTFKPIEKSMGEERYVLGIVLEPETVDGQRDVYSADEVRKTAHKYLADYRVIGLQHEGSITEKVDILESYLAPVDFMIGNESVKKGSWLLGVRVNDDEIWNAVKRGDLTGYSIGGHANRNPDPVMTKLTNGTA